MFALRLADWEARSNTLLGHFSKVDGSRLYVYKDPTPLMSDGTVYQIYPGDPNESAYYEITEGETLFAFVEDANGNLRDLGNTNDPDRYIYFRNTTAGDRSIYVASARTKEDALRMVSARPSRLIHRSASMTMSH